MMVEDNMVLQEMRPDPIPSLMSWYNTEYEVDLPGKCQSIVTGRELPNSLVFVSLRN